ncbi:MAG: serine/threonine-protein kinase [Candidatus Zixiibacteriota bacterium]
MAAKKKPSRGAFEIDPERLRRHGPWLLAGLVTLLIVGLYFDDHRIIATWELGIQDFMVSAAKRAEAPDDVVIVTIDDKAVEKLGPWPWDAERVGYLVGMLHEYNPKAIGLDFEMPKDATRDPVGNLFLADMIERAGNVVLPIRFAVGEGSHARSGVGDLLKGSGVVCFDQALELMEYPYPLAHGASVPYEEASRAAWALGQVNTWQDVDGKVRRDPLLVKFEGDYYPSMALQLARCVKGVHHDQMRITPGQGLSLAGLFIPSDEDGTIMIDYRGPAKTVRSVSAERVLEGEPVEKEIAGKVVVVGVTASGYGTTLRTPASDVMPRTEKIATVASNILNGRFITNLRLSSLIDVSILLAISLFCGFVLPRVTLTYRFVILGVMAFLFVDLNFFLYNSFNLVTKTLYPSLQILLFLALAPAMKSWAAEPKTRVKKAATPAVTPAVGEKTGSGPVRVVREDGPMRAISGLEKTGGVRTNEIATRELAADAGDHTNEVETPTQVMDQSPRPLGGTISSGGSGSVPATAVEDLGLKQLGRYEILSVLGQGAMGTVYKGRDPEIDRMVALKTIRAGIGEDPARAEELRERLVREAKAAGKLSHPNIVTVYDVGAEGELRYIAMEYLEGYTLEQVVKKRVQLNYRIAAKIILQVCNALEYAHKAGIVHRDVKPANIMVLDNFEIKVTDFGIARFDTGGMSMTQTGIAMGTPHYISPEQLRGEPVDRRCDIFSLGVVAYELLTRQKPFSGESISQLIYQITQVNPKPPSDLDENIPSMFDTIVLKALAKDPLERYQTVEQMGQALKIFTEDLAATPYRI